MIHNRIVLHFPGFEPLDAEAHRQRYTRSAVQASAVWKAMERAAALPPLLPCPSKISKVPWRHWRLYARLLMPFLKA